MSSLECTCKEWNECGKKVFKAIGFAESHARCRDITVFKFCPWCREFLFDGEIVNEAVRRIKAGEALTLCPQTARVVKIKMGFELNFTYYHEYLKTDIWARFGEVEIKMSREGFDL